MRRWEVDNPKKENQATTLIFALDYSYLYGLSPWLDVHDLHWLLSSYLPPAKNRSTLLLLLILLLLFVCCQCIGYNVYPVFVLFWVCVLLPRQAVVLVSISCFMIDRRQWVGPFWLRMIAIFYIPAVLCNNVICILIPGTRLLVVPSSTRSFPS